MSQTIWKYPVIPDDNFSVSMPQSAQILTVQSQHGEPMMWALVDSAASLEERRFAVFGTGYDIPDPAALRYVGIFQIQQGSRVFHLFEEMV